MAFTEASFKAFCHSALSRTADLLGWSVDGGDYDAILDEAVLYLGVSSIGDLTDTADLIKARVVGRWLVWQAVAAATAGDYQFSADGGSYSPQQVHEQALKMADRYLSDAVAAGVEAGSGYVVTAATVSYHKDAYRDYNDDLTAEFVET